MLCCAGMGIKYPGFLSQTSVSSPCGVGDQNTAVPVSSMEKYCSRRYNTFTSLLIRKISRNCETVKVQKRMANIGGLAVDFISQLDGLTVALGSSDYGDEFSALQD